MTIILSAYVDNNSAGKLNLAPPKLEFTLILHTALGKDDFITISGNYRTSFHNTVFSTSFSPLGSEMIAYERPCTHPEYTCFANTLERLTRLPGPISKLKSPEEVMPAGQAINAPTEIMRLINWMMTHVSATVRTTDIVS